MEKKITCLVSGGAGFIGSHLCERLLSQNYEVICVDNLITGSKQNIELLLGNPNFLFIEHDVIKPLPSDLLKTKNIRFIYHLASPASPPQYRKYSIETMQVNSVGTKNLLDIAKMHRSSLLLASTSEVYGDPMVHPQTEEYFGNVNSVGPRACYDESKRFAEALAMEYFRKFNCDVRIVRIFNTYGPKMQKDDGRVISNFVNQAIAGQPITIYGDGKQTRSFCYVSDLITGLVLLCEEEGTRGQIVNMGYPKEHTISQIAQIVLKLTESPSKIIYKDKPQDDPSRRQPDITKAKKLLGWQPVIDLEEGLNKTIDYFKSI